MMGYEALFWTEFLRTFAPVLGAVVGLLPAVGLALGTIAVALRLHHRQVMARVESARAALGVETEHWAADMARSEARTFLRFGR
jgi:hypothetical protein